MSSTINNQIGRGRRRKNSSDKAVYCPTRRYWSQAGESHKKQFAEPERVGHAVRWEWVHSRNSLQYTQMQYSPKWVQRKMLCSLDIWLGQRHTNIYEFGFWFWCNPCKNKIHGYLKYYMEVSIRLSLLHPSIKLVSLVCGHILIKKRFVCTH